MRLARYVYWIAAGDRAYGGGDEPQIEALRALWHAHRAVDSVTPFDGASFWVDEGKPHARVVRAAAAAAAHKVEVVDVDPSTCL